MLIIRKIMTTRRIILKLLYYAVLQGEVYGYKHALAISQYEVEDTPMRDRERVSKTRT